MDPGRILAVLEKAQSFSWDKGNIDKNWLRHRVSSKECEEVFFNRPLLVSFDEKHSIRTEKRFQVLGKTNGKRKLFIVFTIRNKKIRVVSARDQNKRERRQYVSKKT